MKKQLQKKGFTLIELLVVIAIIAILAAIIVLVINPIEMMRRSRDSQRMSDLSTLQTAINLALADGRTFSGVADKTYATRTDATVYTGDVAPANTGTSTQSNAGTGWIPLDFSAVSSGAPVSSLPLDPSNGASNWYRFVFNGTDYKIDCAFESTEYTPRHGTDGGNNANRYEVGNDLTVAAG